MTMRDPLRRYPGYVLRRAATATRAELAARLAPLSLRQADVSVLMLIDENRDVTASAIGRHLDIQRANMAPLLKRLEDAGLIGRTALDKRSHSLHLTDKGKDVTDRARAIITGFERELLDRVPAEHRAHLLPALEAIWRAPPD